jgi:hypothetical protein
MFAQTNNDNGNRTDIVIAPAVSVTSAVAAKFVGISAAPPVTPEFRQKVNDNILHVMRGRFPNWPRNSPGDR